MRRTLTMCVFLALGFLIVATAGGGEEPVPLLQAHSHNDYTRTRPLLDALDAGFCSFEADIHLVDGTLLVAHDREECEPGKTLEKLYLDPLLERSRKNGGRVYPDGPPVVLLIDIKSSARTTYEKLREVLQGYKEMLTEFTDESTKERAVTVVISGNCPRRTIWSDSPRWASVDGRLPDLDRDTNRHRMPLVSNSWSAVFEWNGARDMSEEEQTRLAEYVKKAHDKGQRIRFWGLPPAPKVWPTLHDAGVDLLNADNLPALQKVLLDRLDTEAQEN